MDFGRGRLTRGRSTGGSAGGAGPDPEPPGRNLVPPEPSVRDSSAADLDDDELAGDLMGRIGAVIDGVIAAIVGDGGGGASAARATASQDLARVASIQQSALLDRETGTSLRKIETIGKSARAEIPQSSCAQSAARSAADAPIPPSVAGLCAKHVGHLSRMHKSVHDYHTGQRIWTA